MSASPAPAGAVEVRAPGGALLARAQVARTAWTRMRGLIGRPLAEGEGLLFRSCSSVHTHFMSYPIDVLYLSRDDVVVKVVAPLRPWRFSWGGRGAKHVLELPSGTAAARGIERGDVLALRAAGAAEAAAVR